MGRTKQPERRPPSHQPEHDPALLAAVRAALAALSEAGKEATPSVIEEWIKANQHGVWSSIATVSALKEAIEVAKREGGRPGSTTKGASGMARKKTEDQGEAPPEQAAPPKPASASTSASSGSDQEQVTEVVRKALNGVGTEADNEAVKGWIAVNYPDREFNPGTLNTTISAQRAKMKRDRGEESPPSVVKPRQTRATGYDPTRSELLHVLEIARQESGVSKLRKMVQTVKQLADLVGGLDHLSVCLDTLEEFGIK